MNARCLGLAILMVAVGAARAQGGPPLVTDDPDTPGDGHWEINLAAIANDAYRNPSVSVRTESSGTLPGMRGSLRMRSTAPVRGSRVATPPP